MKRVLTLSMVAILAMCLVACGDSEEEEANTEDDELVVGLINWPENIAVNHVWKVLLEEEGYDVDVRQLEMGTIMEALSTGDLDVGIEVWLPVQDISYY